MIGEILAPKFLVLYAIVLSALYVHLRGRERFRFTRQLFNHSTLLAPYNALVFLFSAVPAKAFQDVGRFPELAPLREQWTMHPRRGAEPLRRGPHPGRARQQRRRLQFVLQARLEALLRQVVRRSAALGAGAVPATVALLATIPSVKAAMFAILEPDAHLNPHRDPFGGSLRYHLGLVTPNSDACFIVVDGERYSWRDGEAVMFDETFIHWAENKTDDDPHHPVLRHRAAAH